jgi:hypothetical protein
MAARMIGVTRLRSAPDPNAPNPSGVVTKDDAIEIISERQDGTWLEVRATDESGNVRTGFVPADRVDRDAPPPKVEENIDLVRFGVVCTNNARTHGVNRDYLIALAWCESRIKNVGTTDSTAFGPFQFIQDTWNDMVARHSLDTGITEAGFRDWGAQVTFAAILGKEATERIRDRLGRLPSATELYFAHILGVEAALHALQGERAHKMDAVLLEFYEPKQHEKAAAFVDQIIKNNASVFRVDAQVNSTEQVLQALAARLREGFDKAQEIVKQLPADAQPQQGTRVRQAYDHLRAVGFTHEQAAGLVGNFMQESTESLDPNALNEHEGAIGIAQWRLDRRENLKRFAAENGTTETDFNVQIKFVTHELDGSEMHAKAKIQECTTTEDAAIAAREHYERARSAHDNKRIAFAQRVAEMFA